MEQDLQNHCRACMCESNSMLSLFDDYEHGLTLADILQSLIKTEISIDDGLPPHLCDNCTTTLTQFYNFSIIFEESDKQLRSLLQPAEVYLNAADSEKIYESISDIISEDKEDKADMKVKPELNYSLQISDAAESCEYDVDNIKDVDNLFNLEESTEDDKETYVYPVEVESNKEEIDGHSSSNQDESFQRITKYQCNVCGEAHLFALSFQQHMRVKHGVEDVEPEHYASEIRVKVKSKTFKPLSKDEVESFSIHTCNVCNKKFSFPAQLKTHLKMHTGTKKFVCEVCGAGFLRKTYLDDHREGHSSEKKYFCKYCGKAFKRRTVLRAHNRLHTHPKYYVCELCGRGFTNSSTMKTHKLLIHVKARNFLCVICNRSFPLKSTLTKHVLRHQKRENGEKGFNCPKCEMQYKDKSSLKRHIQTKHEGIVSFVLCPECPKQYTSKANLIKHLRKHHNSDLKGEINELVCRP